MPRKAARAPQTSLLAKRKTWKLANRRKVPRHAIAKPMLLSSKFSCRVLMRRINLLAAAALALAAGAASIPSLLRAEEPASPAAEDGAAKNKEGGVMVEVPQSPPLTPLKIGYLRETLEHPRPASRLDVEPRDAGIAGAK